MAIPALATGAGGYSWSVRYPLLVGSVAWLGLGLGACSPSGAAGDPEGPQRAERTGTVASPIIKGEPSDETQDAVVLLVQRTASGAVRASCTATLVASNVAITARHCVSVATDGPFGCSADGKLLPGSTGGKLTRDLDPAELYFFTGKERPSFGRTGVKADARGKAIVHDGADQVCSHDLAMVVLDKGISSVKPAPIRLKGLATPGKTFTSVGWGLTESGREADVRMQRKGVPVLRIGPVEPTATTLAVPVDMFEAGETICQGDSGGPALDEETGAVIGVVSAGGNPDAEVSSNPASVCIGESTRNYYAATGSFVDVIEEAFRIAQSTPWEEGGSEPSKRPVGSTCAADIDCDSGYCGEGDGDGGLVCVQLCSKESPCPSGLACKLEAERPYCAKPDPAAKKEGGCTVRPGGAGLGRPDAERRPSGGPMGAIFALGAIASLARRRRQHDSKCAQRVS